MMKRLLLLLLLTPLESHSADVQVATLVVGEQYKLVREILAEVITPLHQVIAAETSGVVSSPRMEMGSPLLKGQIVVEIESSEQEAILDIARKELASARVEQGLRQRALQRAKINHGQHAISEAQFDEVETMFAKAEAHLALMNSRVKLQVTRLQKYQIRSPFDGQLVRPSPVVGQYVRPGDSVFEIVNTQTRRIAIQLTPAETSGLLEARYTLYCTGKMLNLVSVSPMGEEKTGMTSLELEGCSDGLRPGQHIGVELVETNVARIPEKGIQTDEEGKYVYVVNKGIVFRRALGELQSGENIIVMGTDKVDIGDLVHPIALDLPAIIK